MASTKIEDLTPLMQQLYYDFEALMKKANLPFKVTCTARTLSEQEALYAQGRKTLEETNALRTKAGLPSISATENKRKITWTMKSKHIVKDSTEKSKAFDIVLLKDNRAHWDIKIDVNKNAKPDYIEASELGEAVGLKVGAKFSTPDYPHYEEPISSSTTKPIELAPSPESKKEEPLSEPISLPAPDSSGTASFGDFLKELALALIGLLRIKKHE